MWCILILDSRGAHMSYQMAVIQTQGDPGEFHGHIRAMREDNGIALSSLFVFQFSPVLILILEDPCILIYLWQELRRKALKWTMLIGPRILREDHENDGQFAPLMERRKEGKFRRASRRKEKYTYWESPTPSSIPRWECARLKERKKRIRKSLPVPPPFKNASSPSGSPPVILHSPIKTLISSGRSHIWGSLCVKRFYG